MNNLESIRILSIFHYIVGGLHALIGCFGLLHFFMGLSMLVSPQIWNSESSSLPSFFPWIFIIAGGGFVLFGVTMGILTALSGRFISQFRHRNYSIIIGAINCVLIPFGTVLGIFDIILLTKDEVKAHYKNT